MWSKRSGALLLATGALVAAVVDPGCSSNEGTTSTSTGAGGATSTTTTTAMSAGGSGPTTSGSMSTNSSSQSTGASMCAPASFGGALAPGANGGFKDAFDAAPDSGATTVYFLAVDPMGNPGVFSQGICPAGAVKAVYTGGIFEAPVNIAVSSDDKTLYVADISAAEDPTAPTKDKGVLLSLPSAGGTAPSILVGSVAPRGVTVVNENGADVVYFTGTDKANGLPGVFKVTAAGGAVTTIAEGAPFSDPGGVTVAASGTIYVADTSGSSDRSGNVIVVNNGTATELVANVPGGYPAGIALMKDDSKLLVSGVDPTASADALLFVDLATKNVTADTNVVGAFQESAGLHRAAKADVFAWADTKATPMGMTGTGTVFVIK